MPLLIDGHNLIGRLPDIRLDDLDDEVELVERVRRYCWRRRRRATVVFDRGLPGGPDHILSGSLVEVVFAATGSTADAVITERIRRSADPRGLVVVSSDRDVQAVARSLGARVIPAETLAEALVNFPQSEEEMETEKPESSGDLDEWLQLFGDAE